MGHVAEGKTLSFMKPKKETGFPTILESLYQHWMISLLNYNERRRGRREVEREKEEERERKREKEGG